MFWHPPGHVLGPKVFGFFIDPKIHDFLTFLRHVWNHFGSIGDMFWHRFGILPAMFWGRLLTDF